MDILVNPTPISPRICDENPCDYSCNQACDFNPCPSDNLCDCDVLVIVPCSCQGVHFCLVI